MEIFLEKGMIHGDYGNKSEILGGYSHTLSRVLLSMMRRFALSTTTSVCETTTSSSKEDN